MGQREGVGNQEREYMKPLKTELHALPAPESTQLVLKTQFQKEMRCNTIERRGIINENIEV